MKCWRHVHKSAKFGDKVGEMRMRGFGHVQGRDSGHFGQRMLELELLGRKTQGDHGED